MNEKEYKCNKCGNIFPESEIRREIDNPELFMTRTKYVSPCCCETFTDEW